MKVCTFFFSLKTK